MYIKPSITFSLYDHFGRRPHQLTIQLRKMTNALCKFNMWIHLCIQLLWFSAAAFGIDFGDIFTLSMCRLFLFDGGG